MTTTTAAAEPKDAYGLLAEFEHSEQLVNASQMAYNEGYRWMDAYSPFPVEGAAEAIGFRNNRIPLVVLVGGLVGGATGYLMQWYSAVVHYPLNVGGRPFHSWPSFIPITFEMTVLCAAFAAVLGTLGLSGLPRPHHPLFAVPNFDRATRDRFFLCIQRNDPRYHPEETRRFLERTGAVSVVEVPR